MRESQVNRGSTDTYKYDEGMIEVVFDEEHGSNHRHGIRTELFAPAVTDIETEQEQQQYQDDQNVLGNQLDKYNMVSNRSTPEISFTADECNQRLLPEMIQPPVVVDKKGKVGGIIGQRSFFANTSINQSPGKNARRTAPSTLANFTEVHNSNDIDRSIKQDTTMGVSMSIDDMDENRSNNDVEKFDVADIHGEKYRSAFYCTSKTRKVAVLVIVLSICGLVAILIPTVFMRNRSTRQSENSAAADKLNDGMNIEPDKDTTGDILVPKSTDSVPAAAPASAPVPVTLTIPRTPIEQIVYDILSNGLPDSIVTQLQPAGTASSIHQRVYQWMTTPYNKTTSTFTHLSKIEELLINPATGQVQSELVNDPYTSIKILQRYSVALLDALFHNVNDENDDSTTSKELVLKSAHPLIDECDWEGVQCENWTYTKDGTPSYSNGNWTSIFGTGTTSSFINTGDEDSVSEESMANDDDEKDDDDERPEEEKDAKHKNDEKNRNRYLQSSSSNTTTNSTFLIVSVVKALSWSNKQLSGILPSELLNLHHLEHLDLSQNAIMGTIPDFIYTSFSQQIKILNLMANELSGSLSTNYINSLTKLQKLLLGSNQLTGPIPTAFPPALTYLSLYNNSLTGPLPEQWILKNLVFLDIGYNELSGTFPAAWTTGSYSLGMLNSIFIDNNKLTGPLPDSFPSLGSGTMGEIHINDNKFSGSFDFNGNEYNEKGQLNVISIHNNNLTGLSDNICKLGVFSSGELIDLQADCSICSCSGGICDNCYK